MLFDPWNSLLDESLNNALKYGFNYSSLGRSAKYFKTLIHKGKAIEIQL